VYRAILLQTEATRAKNRILSEFVSKATRETNRIIPLRQGYQTASRFQTAIVPILKSNAGFHIQVICDIARDTWSKPKTCLGVKAYTIKFNIPRNCNTFVSKRFFFVELRMYPGQRIAVPIKNNRNLTRLKALLKAGWTCKTYGLTPSLEIVAFLSKATVRSTSSKNVIGIDINAKDFAYTVLAPEGRILKQGYLGRQMWSKKHHFEERRALLQTLKALKKLRAMRHRRSDYVKTNIGQVVRELMILAKKYSADISIERLSRFKPKGKRFNRKVMSIPFYLFRRTLEARCFDDSVTLNRVDAYHTSKWCTRCGAVGKGHDGSNYSLFRCMECGLTMNSDRKASLAVAVKTFLERSGTSNENPFQISGRRVPVGGLIRHVTDATKPEVVVH
jgi:IS605 OrfB family transposase